MKWQAPGLPDKNVVGLLGDLLHLVMVDLQSGLELVVLNTRRKREISRVAQDETKRPVPDIRH